MKRKLLLSVGSAIAVATPIVVVVSCGHVDTPSEESVEIYQSLTSKSSANLLEKKWQEKLISEKMLDGKKLEDIQLEWAKKLIRTKVDGDKSYLRNIGLELFKTGQGSKDDNYTKEHLTQNGLWQYYIDSSKIFKTEDSGNLTDEGVKLVLNDKSSTFAFEVNKMIIANYYLTHVTKDQYLEASGKVEAQDLSAQEELYDGTEFRMIKEAIDKRLFASWDISLSAEESASFGSIGELDKDNALKQFVPTTGSATGAAQTMADKVKYTDSKSKYKGLYATLLPKANIEDYVAYKGISTLPKVGSKLLKFSSNTLKMVDGTTTTWKGIVQKDDLVTTGIKLVQDDASVATLKYIYGFMPNYKNGKFVLVEDHANHPDKWNAYAELFVNKDSSLYEEAKKFYTTDLAGEDNKAVILDLNNEDVADLYKDDLQVQSITQKREIDNEWL